jgi:hypothetical protein
MVMSVIALGTIIPESAAAQDAPSSEVIERGPNEGDPVPEPERFEVSAGVSLFLGGGAGIGGAGYQLDALRMGGDVGFPLGSRALITLGARAAVTSMTGTYVLVSVPVTALVYLDAPRAGAFVPTVRVGVAGTLTDFSGLEDSIGGLGPSGSLGLHVLARGGLTWFIVEAVGIRAEVGVNAELSLGNGYTVFGVGMDAAASMVMRI